MLLDTCNIYENDDGITEIQKTLSEMSTEHPQRSVYLGALARHLFSRFERLDLIGDLNESIAAFDEALNLQSEGHPERVETSLNLGSVLRCRFEHTGSEEDLNRGIRVVANIKNSIRDDNPLRPRALDAFAGVLLRRFQYKGASSLADLNEAIQCDELALSLVMATDADRKVYLHNLGNLLRIRFERTGSTIDLNRAIEFLREAIGFVSGAPPSFLSDFGHALLRRYGQTGNMEDLQDAVLNTGLAVTSVPLGHAYRPLYLNNFGNALHQRFNRTTSMEDLNKAVEMHQEAVNSTRKSLKLAKYLNSLSYALEARYSRNESLNDLNRSIKAIEEAVDIIPNEHSNRSKYLSTLSNGLYLRFSQTGSWDDFNRAVVISKQIVKSTPMDHPNRAIYLSNLGSLYEKLSIDTNEIGYLDKAIAVFFQAAISIPREHPYRSECLIKLGQTLEQRMKQSDRLEILWLTVAVYEHAANLSSGPPIVRINGAINAGQLLHELDIIRAGQAFKQAVRLIPLLSPRTLSHSDQHSVHSYIRGVASAATAFSLQSGDSAIDALQLLETGRGNLISLRIEMRADADVRLLDEQYPKLAQTFQALRDAMNRPQDDNLGSITESTVKIRQRQAAASEYDTTLKLIRELPGFESFLEGPSAKELVKLAVNGPVVVFNVNPIRSDAFIVTSNGINCLSLPDLRYKEVEEKVEWLSKLNPTLMKTYHRRQTEMRDLLKWLWVAAVGPILESLGFRKTPPDGAVGPHVWWIPSGSLTSLPIHAAGDHRIKGESALDRVISSYSLTVKSLAYAREKASSQNANPQKATFVAMSSTPGHTALPNVIKEIDSIKRLLPSHVQASVLLNPKRAEVIKQLEDCQILHFACHGKADVEDPSESCLYLEDGEMTVKDIMPLKSRYAQLAYLSACHAAVNNTEKLVDEGIHLAGTFQLAGFPHVIGTLWQIRDCHSVEVAESAYSALCTDSNVDHSRIACGLHEGVRQLRGKTRRNLSKGDDDPLLRAPYIHMGA